MHIMAMLPMDSCLCHSIHGYFVFLDNSKFKELRTVHGDSSRQPLTVVVIWARWNYLKPPNVDVQWLVISRYSTR